MMHLHFSVAPYSNDQALAAWLSSAGFKPSKADDCPKGEPLLLGYHEPEHALQAAMQQGDMPGKALAQWVAQTRRMLAQFKADRANVALVNLAELAEAPTQAAGRLAERWDVEGEGGQASAKAGKQLAPLPLLHASEQAGSTAYLRLLAKELIEQSDGLPKLLAELEACTLPLIDKPAKPQAVAVDAAFQQWLAEHTQQQSLIQQHEALSADKAMMKRQLDAKDAEARQLEQQRIKLDEENALLVKQLHLVQEEFAATIQQNGAQADEKTALEMALDKRTGEIQRLEQERKEQQYELKTLRQMHTSLKSKKATQDRQLESLQETLQSAGQKADQQRAESEEESQLLLEQLHLVQEEMERSLLSGQQQEQRLEEAQQQQLLLQRRLEKMAHQRHQLHQRVEEAGKRLEEQQATEQNRLLKLAGALQRRTRGKGRQARRILNREQELIAASGLFERDWYLRTYPDVAKAGVDPVWHYLTAGAGEGRNPGTAFDTVWYLTTYFDVVESGLNPLVHFIRFGRKEQRTPHPNFLALPAPAETAEAE